MIISIKNIPTDCIYKGIWLKSKKQRGFSLLELVLVVAIISLLFVVAVDKLLILKVEAERTAMAQILGSLRSAMGIQVASHISKNKVDELIELTDSNPMDWLAEKPENYIGVLDEPDPADIKIRTWYFDSYNKYLVYRVSSSGYFKSSLKGVKRARFRVNLDYTDVDGDGEFNQEIDKIHGLTLKNVEPYQWLAEPIDINDYTSPNNDAIETK